MRIIGTGVDEGKGRAVGMAVGMAVGLAVVGLGLLVTGGERRRGGGGDLRLGGGLRFLRGGGLRLDEDRAESAAEVAYADVCLNS